MDRKKGILEKLKSLSREQFRQLVFCLNIPAAELPDDVSQAEKAMEVYSRLEQEQDGLERLEKTLAEPAISIIGEQYIGYEIELQVKQIVSDYTQQPFEGREEEKRRLDEFLMNNASGVFLVTGAAGFGKSALLSQWQQTRQEDCFIAYHCFSYRYEKTRSLFEAYRHLLKQLYYYYNIRNGQFPNDENGMRDILVGMLRQPVSQNGKPLVIVLDGLDEADKTFEPFFTSLPDGVFVIASARAEEGDEPEYLRNWTDSVQRLCLKRLSREAIAKLLGQITELAAYSEDNEFVKSLDETTGGFPLYLRFLIDDLRETARKRQDVRELLAQTPKDFEKYVEQQLDRLDKLDLPEQKWQFFALLAVAKGVLEKQDIKVLTTMRDRHLRQLNQYWQVTRWMRITEGKLYAFAHPLLAKTFAAQLGDDAEDALQALIDYCTKWQEHHSAYALRYCAEHLLDVKRWEELYAIARNEDFASTQQQQLPDEPDLPLKTVQTALLGAAEEDKAEKMAEFVLIHAHKLGQTNAQQSPLEALRSGSLKRAWKLAEQFEIERCILWYLLLAWELKDEGKLDEARETLDKLQKKELPHFQVNWDTRWQGDYAAYLLAYVFDINKDTSTVLVQQLLENDRRRLVCKTLIEHGDFDDALETADMISEPFNRVLELINVAKAQAVKGQRDAPRSTFAKALEIIQKADLHILWVYEIVRIAEAQIEELEDIEAARNTLENAFEKAQNIFTIERKTAQEIEDREKRQDTLLEIARMEAEVNELIDDTLKSTETNKNRRRATKDNSNPGIKQNNPLEIAYNHAKAENFSAMLEIMETIEGLVPIKALASIANSLAKEGATKTARTTFAAALQIPQRSEVAFLQALALSDVADVQVASEQKEAGTTTISMADQIVQKINNPTKQVIVLGRIAKVLANAGNGKEKEAKTIFNSLIKIIKNIKIQEERVNSFTFIAKTQIKIKEFTAAFNTAQRIEFPWIKAKVLGILANAQAEAGQDEEFQTTLTTALEIAEEFFSHMEWLWIDVICEKAMAQAVKHKEAALATFKKLLEFAQESGKQRDIYLSKIAAAQAQAGEIYHALKTTDEIEDESELVKALSWIALTQFKKGKKQELLKTLTAALQAKDKIENKQKLMQALKAIAGIQVMAGKGKEAVRTAEKILTERNLYLPGIASWLVETGDRENFKCLLIPCAYYLDAAYQICGLLAKLYPEKAESVAEAVKDFTVSST